jgi:hypothetical protein
MVTVGDEVAATTPGVTDAEFPFVMDPGSIMGKGVDVLKLNSGTSGS